MLYWSYRDCKKLRVEAQLQLGAKADQLKELESALERSLRSLENTKSKVAKNESNKVKLYIQLGIHSYRDMTCHSLPPTHVKVKLYLR